MHDTALIATIAGGIGLAFVLGLIANRLRMPALVGYLLAGVAVGPFTPGFVADTHLAPQLAEIGVILLMFGVGIHFSVKDLMAVRKIAIPGAIGQIAAATALGAAVAHLWWGWDWGAGIVFGLCLSVASTVVLLRALEQRGLLDTLDGRIAIGWLIVEDLVTVLVLVLLPALAGVLGGSGVAADGHHAEPAHGFGMTVAITLGKVGAFVAFMFVVGRRVVPWLLERVARTGSRELFTLCVLAVALGTAVGSATLFGVSFALGAFFAGMVVNGSDLSHDAAENALPLQDAFSVLFFVSVGMLFDPKILIERPLEVLAVVLIVAIGKSIAAFSIVVAFRYPVRTALLISASLAQIGEFSFILVALGGSLGLLPPEGQQLVVAGALLSITLNAVAFAVATRTGRWLNAMPKLMNVLEPVPRALSTLTPSPAAETVELRGHAVIVGYGRVGSTIGESLAREGVGLVVVEQSRETVAALRTKGLRAIAGDGSRPGTLERAEIATARLLVVTSPDPFQTRAILERARKLNPHVRTVVRTHSASERDYLVATGAGKVVLGENELALAMVRHSLDLCDVKKDA